MSIGTPDLPPSLPTAGRAGFPASAPGCRAIDFNDQPGVGRGRWSTGFG